MNNVREMAGNNSDVTRVNDSSNVRIGTANQNNDDSKFKSNALI